MNKKNVLLVGLVAVVIFILLGVGETKFGLDCSFRMNERMDPYAGGFGSNGEYRGGLVWDKVEWCEPIAFGLLAPLILLVPFSLLTYKMREEVFRAWLHFAYWWIPLSIVLTLLASGGSGGGFGIPNVFDQEFVAFVFSVLFAIISLVIILWKYLATRKKR